MNRKLVIKALRDAAHALSAGALVSARARSAQDLERLGGHIVHQEQMGGGVHQFRLFTRPGRSEDGHIRIRWSSSCHVWEVMNVAAPKGWGPLLYDLAMEYVGPDGITADRGSVTPAAERVWTYYYKQRSDVWKHYMPEDPKSSGCHFFFDREEHRADGDPLDFKYVAKRPVVMPALKARGLLVEHDQ